MPNTRTRSWLSHPGWALLFVGVPLLVGFCAGPLFIDDAYITFRYAENLYQGRGFVYNTEPLLGTTAPLYCFMLAGARFLGVSMSGAALGIGVIFGGLAPLLCWRLGVSSGRPKTGFVSALLLSLFPHWWRISSTGMETTLAASLALFIILLDIKDRTFLGGAFSTLLVLVRPDAATLPLVIFLVRAVGDRRSAFRFAGGAALVLVPWLVYAFLIFGSPLPQSLAAKRLMHAYPWYLALGRYFFWFASFRGPEWSWSLPDAAVFFIRAGMAVVFSLWVFGTITMLRSWREGLVLVLWPLLFILSLCAIEVDTFFWYKMPVVPVYFFVAALGWESVYSWRGKGESLAKRRTARVLRGALVLIIALFITLQLANAFFAVFFQEKLKALVAKERIFEQMAQSIQERAEEQGKALEEVKVYLGEVGVIGYELMDSEIIDSAGINSRQVFEIRKRDWERLQSEHPDYSWQEQRWGSVNWSREVVEKYRPEFIASDLRYLHLQTLAREPDFAAKYRLLRSWSDEFGNRYVVLERSAEH